MVSLICPSCKNRKKQRYLSKSGEIKLKGYCRPCSIKKNREWYNKNKLDKINKSKSYQKRTGYVSEKTPKQRKIRYIKRRTRIKYPLTNQKCYLCSSKATERHHFTYPISEDNFIFICHSCHRKVHEDKNLNKKIVERRDLY